MYQHCISNSSKRVCANIWLLGYLRNWIATS